MYAVHAIAPQSSTWHTPSATRGRLIARPIADPRLLPTPRPIRNTARINENVYTVAPKRSDNSRVHTTSAARAVMPESAMVTYTDHASAARSTRSGGCGAGSYEVALAIASPRAAAVTFN